MLIHKKCGQKVVLDLGPAIKFVAGFGYRESGLYVTLVNMIKLTDHGDSKFVCPYCQKETCIDELLIYCNHCSARVPATEAVLPKNSGGIYCKHCGDTFFDGEYTPLELSTFTIARDALK